jgi:putative endonuclease
VQRGFTKKHNVVRLVWYEVHDSREGAITRERQIKAWKRRWKIEMIEAGNRDWRDLYEALNALPEGQAPLVLDDKPIPEPL